MPTSFPSAVDSFVNPQAGNRQNNPSHLQQHILANDAISALQGKVGIDGSIVTSSLDYLVKNPSSVNPGHKHSLASLIGTANQVVFGDVSGALTSSALLSFDSLSGRLTTTLLQAKELYAFSASAQPIVYAFAQNDLGKYVQLYHSGTAGFLTALGGSLTITSSSGDLTLNVPTGNYVNINERILTVNAATTWVTSGGGAETPAWLHLFSSNAVQSTGGFSHQQITMGRDGASVADQSNGLFVTAVGDYAWCGHFNIDNASNNSFGVVVGNHGTNSHAAIFYYDFSATNVGVGIYNGVSGTTNMMEFHSDRHPVLGNLGTAFTGNYISFQDQTTELAKIDYTGSALFKGLSLKAGGSTSNVKVGGVLFDYFTNAGNSGTSETDLYSSSIPASTLQTDGDKIVVEYQGVYGSNATPTKQLKVYFGGTTVFDSTGISPLASAAWHIRCVIQRDSSNSVRVSTRLQAGYTLSFNFYSTLGSLTFSNALTLKVTGTAAGGGAASNDVVATMGHVSWLPAGA